jgi:NAD(P)-dependent dehydrogenase (short-subunit alcohol dehydrogenase family)
MGGKLIISDMFDLTGKIIVITGGAGLLGQQYAEAIAEYKGIPVILDLSDDKIQTVVSRIKEQYRVEAVGMIADITSEEQISQSCQKILKDFGKVDVLINNAARNPKVEENDNRTNFSRLEDFDLELWNQDLAVGLTGSFLCAKHFGHAIARNPKGGVIINISSDLGVIAPDQRLYYKEGVPEKLQCVKPITYSIVKSGLIGLTRYLATYWADKNVRCNAVCPGGVFDGQDEAFVQKVNQLIPLGRMASKDEYKGVIVFLASDASLYMNGAIVSIDGGRSVW